MILFVHGERLIILHAALQSQDLMTVYKVPRRVTVNGYRKRCAAGYNAPLDSLCHLREAAVESELSVVGVSWA